MLTADQLDALVDPILDLYEAYQQSVINDIARRLGKMSYASAAWQMQRLTESGAVFENALDEISKISGMSESMLREIFQKAGVRAMRFDDSIYRAAGLKPLPLNLSPAMARVLAAGLAKTNGVVQNLTLTTAASAQSAFIEAADLAYMQISNGAMSYQQAIGEAIKGVAANGLETIQYAGGRADQLDVAMRRTVLTGVNQTAGKLQETRANEMGSDLVQTSAHIGARPTHQVWQGQIFSRSGSSKKYPDFVTSTGYGTPGGLMGVNCRHSFYPFFEGLSIPAYDRATLDEYADEKVMYQGKQMSVYDATQEQRYIERKIRYWKRQEGALNAAGVDASMETAKVKAWQARMRDFTKQTGLDRDYFRERVYNSSIPKMADNSALFTTHPIPDNELAASSIQVSNQTIKEAEQKIDFRSSETQLITVSGDLRHCYPEDPGQQYAVPRPVYYNSSAAHHLNDETHEYRVKLIEMNQAGFIQALQAPDFIEAHLRLRDDGHYSSTQIVKLWDGGKNEQRFLVVAVSLSLDVDGGFHQITTIHPARWTDLFYANGILKAKYRAVIK